ncbi:MAG: glycosyltransferase, partial [bacterium]
MTPKVAAILPALNEEETIGPIIDVLQKSGLIDEIVVVADGCTDRTAERARARGATVYEFKENRGKGQAVRQGVIKTSAPILLLLDTDLLGLTVNHIRMLLEPVMQGKLVMNAGYKDRGPLTPFSSHILMAGQRALKREIFTKIPVRLLRGYSQEVALNYYCKLHKLPFGHQVLPGLDFRKKIEKV